MTSGINAKGRFGKQDFLYIAEDDVYLCPAGKRLALPKWAIRHGGKRTGAVRIVSVGHLPVSLRLVSARCGDAGRQNVPTVPRCPSQVSQLTQHGQTLVNDNNNVAATLSQWVTKISSKSVSQSRPFEPTIPPGPLSFCLSRGAYVTFINGCVNQARIPMLRWAFPGDRGKEKEP